MSTERITVETVVAVSPEEVWEFYTAPEHITGWNFASDSWCCPSAENDLRPGGTYRARMEAKDGSFGFDFVGVYSAVEAPGSFTYELEDGRQVTTTFTPVEGGTRVVTVFEADAENEVEMQRSGWQAILDNFRAYAERR